MSKNIKSRRYCFTIPNYTKEDLDTFHIIAQSCDKHHYICYGLEIAPDTGMQHIQGYIELNESQRFMFLHKYFGFTRNKKILKFHIEIANGTASENKKYVSKEGTSFEFGEPQTQGSRTDLKLIKSAIKEQPQDLFTVVDELVNNHQQLRYAQGLQQFYFKNRDPNVPPTVFWVFGPTGVGKTSSVYRNFDDICSVSSYNWLGTGYIQNECLLLDDFRESSLPFEDILKITDRYPYTLFYKGGQIPLNSAYIIITSPKSISDTFHSTREDIQQLKRRVIEIHLAIIEESASIDFKNLDPKYIHQGVNDYKRYW